MVGKRRAIIVLPVPGTPLSSRLAGDGADAISRRFNQEGIKPWGKSSFWHKSYLAKILTGGEVTGTYHPSRLQDGKRTLQEPIQGFFPAVIERELFDQVRAAMKARTLGAGRTGVIANLFTHLARCGYCGEPMNHVNKGKPPRGGQYLVCSLARAKVKRKDGTVVRETACEYHALRYTAVEEAFLRYCSEVNLAEILTQDDRADEMRQVQFDIDMLYSTLKDTNNRIDGLMATIAAVTNKSMASMLAKELDEAGELKDELLKKKEIAEAKLETLSRPGNGTATQIEAIRELRGKLENPDTESRIQIRARLKQAIARAVAGITCFPFGLKSRLPVFEEGGITLQEGPSPSLDSEFPEFIAEAWKSYLIQNTGRDAATFMVKFRNGHSRLFRWSKDDGIFHQTMVDDGINLELNGLKSSKKSSFLPKGE
jgi:hypothetical protein